MYRFSDIPINLTVKEVVAQRPDVENRPDLAETVDQFNRLRSAAAVYDLVDRAFLPPDLAEKGAVAAAGNLGPDLDRLDQGPAAEAVIQTGLFWLEAYINYRIMKHVTSKKLFLSRPIVPGGMRAPDLAPAEVLAQLPGHGLGLEAIGGQLKPAWSLALAYGLQSTPESDSLSPCAGCAKSCSLRR